MAEDMAAEMLERFEREQRAVHYEYLKCPSDIRLPEQIEPVRPVDVDISPLTRLFNAIRELQKAFEALKLDG